MRIGYSRAARLIDMLEDKGIVGPADGAKPREVYDSPTPARLADSQDDVTPVAADDQEDGEWEKA